MMGFGGTETGSASRERGILLIWPWNTLGGLIFPLNFRFLRHSTAASPLRLVLNPNFSNTCSLEPVERISRQA